MVFAVEPSWNFPSSPYQTLPELPKLLSQRYSSFQTENGKKYEKGELTLEDLYDLSLKFGEPKKISGKQELFESIINNYI